MGRDNKTGHAVYAALWRLSAFVGFAMAGWIAIYTFNYEPLPATESPGYVTPIGLAVAGALGAIALLQLVYQDRPPRVMRGVFLVSYLAGAFAMLNLFRFDPREQLFVLLIVALALAAMVLTVKGAVIMWAIAAVAYTPIAWQSHQGQSQHVTGLHLEFIIIALLRITVMLFVATLIAKLVQHFATTVDSEKKRSEEAAYQARLLNEVRDAVVATDVDGSITTWNRGAERMYGWEGKEVLGRQLDGVLQPKLLELSSAFETGDERCGLFLHRTKDGSEILVEAAGIPLSNGATPSGYVTVNRDVTERVHADEAARAAQTADEANKAKNEFLARMSHELRTPLNAVLGFAQLLIMDGPTSSQRDNAEQIMRGGNHLLTLIDEILDTTRVEDGNLALEVVAVPVSGAVVEAASMVEILAQERNVTLVLPADDGTSWVFADKVRFKQVLLNLLSNAIKYNREGGVVRVDVDETPDGYTRVAVTDTGQGISPSGIERLFTPFDRLGAEDTAVEGTGLGLVLSKRLTEAMGGRIDVRSEPGVGSCFAVELPTAAAGSFEADLGFMEASWGAGEPTVNHRVLYIEDQLSNMRLMERVFERRPHITLEAAMQGQLGVEIAIQDPPDLILLDMHLPDIPGHEVMMRLRKDPRTANVPVVVISADATDLTMKRMLAAGAVDYLSKPVDVSRLLELVDERIASKQRITSLSASEGGAK